MRHLLLLAVFLGLVGCSTPEQRIEKLEYQLGTGRISRDEYNAKLRKFDSQRLQEARENFMCQ